MYKDLPLLASISKEIVVYVVGTARSILKLIESWHGFVISFLQKIQKTHGACQYYVTGLEIF